MRAHLWASPMAAMQLSWPLVLLVLLSLACAGAEAKQCTSLTGCMSTRSCDHWVDESGGTLSCSQLEDIFQCNCAGCVCIPEPTLPTTTHPAETSTPADPWAVPENPCVVSRFRKRLHGFSEHCTGPWRPARLGRPSVRPSSRQILLRLLLSCRCMRTGIGCSTWRTSMLSTC